MDWAVRKAGISLVGWRGVCTRVPWQWIFSWGPVSVFLDVFWFHLVDLVWYTIDCVMSAQTIVWLTQSMSGTHLTIYGPIFRDFCRQFWMSQNVTSIFFFQKITHLWTVTQTKLRLMQCHNTLMRSRNNWMNGLSSQESRDLARWPTRGLHKSTKTMNFQLRSSKCVFSTYFGFIS